MIREAHGDLWTWNDGQVVARVITTNGYIAQSGKAVMGRGVALQAVDMFGEALKEHLGARLRDYGNHVHAFPPNPNRGRPYWLVTFPVKPAIAPDGRPGYKAKAELGIIRRSCGELLAWALGLFPDGTVVLPRPGCGAGGLEWEEVKPVVEQELDRPVRFEWAEMTVPCGDRFVVVTNQPKE